MPIIFLVRSAASSASLASLTPPPFPRPPAWICAFTTHTGFPAMRIRAAATASSALATSLPRGTATPNPRRMSFAWYSWIFIGPAKYNGGRRGASSASGGPALPFAEQRLELPALDGLAQVIPLRISAVQLAQHRELLAGLDALGDHFHVQARRQR